MQFENNKFTTDSILPKINIESMQHRVILRQRSSSVRRGERSLRGRATKMMTMLLLPAAAGWGLSIRIKVV